MALEHDDEVCFVVSWEGRSVLDTCENRVTDVGVSTKVSKLSVRVKMVEKVISPGAVCCCGSVQPGRIPGVFGTGTCSFSSWLVSVLLDENLRLSDFECKEYTLALPSNLCRGCSLSFVDFLVKNERRPELRLSSLRYFADEDCSAKLLSARSIVGEDAAGLSGDASALSSV